MNECEKNENTRFRWVPDSESRLKSQFQYSRNLGAREQLEWMKHQLEYATFSERFKLRYDLKRGEIYEIDWGINVNAEFSQRHYGVVLVDSGPYNPLVIVCPLKTNKTGGHPRSDIDLGYIDDLNSDHTTLAVINQVKTIDKLRIYSKNVIGTKKDLSENEERDIQLNPNSNGYIPRLNPVKLQMIVDAYCSMIMSGTDR